MASLQGVVGTLAPDEVPYNNDDDSSNRHDE